MIRIMPDMQVGPFGYFLSWFILAMAAIGLLFASTGGAVVWALFWVFAAMLVYMFGKKALRRAT